MVIPLLYDVQIPLQHRQHFVHPYNSQLFLKTGARDQLLLESTNKPVPLTSRNHHTTSLPPPHMLQQWLRQSPGAARFLRGSCCRGPHSGFLRHSPLPTASHRSIRSLQTSATESKERIPLRKQLKQDAKALKAQKRQRRESEEASRQTWELTVGIEIHAQLNTETKLFSSASNPVPILAPNACI